MIFLDICIALIALAGLASAFRMLKGPHRGDRAISADLLFFIFIALLALIGVRVGSPFVYDLVIVATLVGFVAAVSLSRLMSGGRR